MVDFINEVEEELRKDKYNALLRKYGAFIVAVIIAVVAVAGFLEYQKYDAGKKARAASTSFEAARLVEAEGDLLGAIKRYEALAPLAPEGYAGLSYSKIGALKIQLGDMDGAVAAFDNSANTFSRPEHADLARLKAIYILLDEARYDDVKSRAAALDASDSPYKDLARELAAYADLRNGNPDAARSSFLYLSTAPGVIAGVKTRASQALTLMNASRPVNVPPANEMTPEDMTPDTETATPDMQPAAPEDL